MFMLFACLMDDVFLVLRDAHPNDNNKSARDRTNNGQLCKLVAKDPKDIAVLLTLKRVRSFRGIIPADRLGTQVCGRRRLAVPLRAPILRLIELPIS